MPEDDKPPEQPKTVPLPTEDIVHARLDKIVLSMDRGFQRMETSMEVLHEMTQGLRTRMGAMESWKEKVEERMTRASDRVRGVSESDLEQAAQLVHERDAREALAKRADAIEEKVDALGAKHDVLDKKQDTQLAILGRIDSAVKSPMVQRVAKAIGLLIIGYAAAKGIKLP